MVRALMGRKVLRTRQVGETRFHAAVGAATQVFNGAPFERAVFHFPLIAHEVITRKLVVQDDVLRDGQANTLALRGETIAMNNNMNNE